MDKEICKFCNDGEIKLHLPNGIGFKYKICDNCYMTYSYSTQQWLKPDNNILGLFNDNSPIINHR